MDPIFSPFDIGATTPSATDRSKNVGDGAMGKDEFLRLLVSQLSNQDPLNPMDGQQFAAQLAQFTSVEQLMNISDTLAGNGEMNGLLAQSINSGVAAGLIGKTVQASGDQISLTGDEPAGLGFRLDKAADSTKLTIRSEAGTVVREIDLNGRTSGDHQYEWDGLGNDGERLPNGSYTFEITATDAAGDDVQVQTFFKGKVDRITFGQDGIMLWIGKARVPMADVESVE